MFRSMVPLAACLAWASACAVEVLPNGEGSTASATDASASQGTGESEDESESESGDNEAATGDLPDTGEPDLPDDTQPPDGQGCAGLDALIESIERAPSPAAGLELADAFIAEQLYGAHGFPLVEDTRLCVVYRGEAASALALAGDFNAWDPGSAPLSEALPGFAYAIVELDAAPAGLYKIVHPGDDYRADPLARRFGWDEFGEYSQVDAIPGRSHHERYPGFDQGAGELAPRSLTLWLPPDAGAGVGAQLPVIYMHDGQNLFAPDALWGGWQVSTTLAEAVEDQLIAPVIIAGLDNTAARLDEYTQVGDVLDGTPFGGRANEYANFLVEGVMPFVEARYPVSVSPGDTAVLGSSLGGLVSLYIGLRHRERFGYAGSMSGTVGWGSFGAFNPTILADYLDDPPFGLRIYLDSGGDGGGGCPDGSSDNYCDNVEFADALRMLGWVDEQDLVYRWQPGAPHNEAAWAARLLPALMDWFPGGV